MTKHPRSVTWHGVGVQTAAQLERTRRRLDHNRKAVAAVLTKMRRGQSPSLSFEHGMRRWLLSDGTSVTEEVPKIMTADHRVLSVGDALFKNMPGQTWRYRGLKGETHD
jgi:signal-transduction protein with cAMP-binding, CBS, and nucleotidyltransferase domain